MILFLSLLKMKIPSQIPPDKIRIGGPLTKMPTDIEVQKSKFHLKAGFLIKIKRDNTATVSKNISQASVNDIFPIEIQRKFPEKIITAHLLTVSFHILGAIVNRLIAVRNTARADGNRTANSFTPKIL